MHSWRLGEMSWPEVEELIASGRQTLILPTGSMEQHGPHLPLLTDSIIAEALADRLCEQLPALAAPTVFLGCSDHHMSFPGSITTRPEDFIRDVAALISSLSPAGFSEVVIFSGHGGNIPHLVAASDELASVAERSGARMAVIGSTEGFASCFSRQLELAGLTGVPYPHADAGETSLIAAIRPDLVRWEAMEPGYVEHPRLVDLLSGDLRSLTRNGVLGDPRGASPEIGDLLLVDLARMLAEEALQAFAL